MCDFEATLIKYEEGKEHGEGENRLVQCSLCEAPWKG